MNVEVVLETSLGSLQIAVHSDEAPASARAFLALVDDGSFARDGSFYRTVRAHENDRGRPAIDVIQGGLRQPSGSLGGIRHESTRATGLRHLEGTVSLARGALGTATGAAFFICIGDQPALDAGGGRDPAGDGRGFAAFGRIIAGMDTVRMIHRLPAVGLATDPYQRGQMLDPPVRILSASRQSR